MTEAFAFGEELREQLAQANQALQEARDSGDEEGIEFYADRVFTLRWMAAEYGIDLPHPAEEEAGES